MTYQTTFSSYMNCNIEEENDREVKTTVVSFIQLFIYILKHQGTVTGGESHQSNWLFKCDDKSVNISPPARLQGRCHVNMLCVCVASSSALPLSEHR